MSLCLYDFENEKGNGFADLPAYIEHLYSSPNCSFNAFGNSIRIPLNFVLKGTIDNKAALIYVMAWCQTGDKPSPEPMLTQFTDGPSSMRKLHNMIHMTP